MSSISMSGNDSLTINNRILSDLADGDAMVLTYPNEIAQVKTGKNGNAIYGLNESGKQADMVIRLIRGSSDDKFLNGLLSTQQTNFAGFPLMFGEFVKKVGDSKGNISNDTYILSGGVFTKQVEGKSNVEGDTEQSVAIYHMRFSISPRAIT